MKLLIGLPIELMKPQHLNTHVFMNQSKDANSLQLRTVNLEGYHFSSTEYLAENDSNEIEIQLSRYIVMFTGWISNIEDLERKVNLDTKEECRTIESLIAHAYDKYGKDFQRLMEGSWSICIFDKQDKSVFLSRDRLGIKPLYYSHCKGGLAFSTRIKPLLGLCDYEIKADNEVLETYIALGVHDFCERTMFKDVLQLLPGQSLFYSLGSNEIKLFKWFEYQSLTTVKRDYSENVQRFRNSFFKAVSKCYSKNDHVGLTLSGGLDSSAIACTLSHILSGKKPSSVKSFTSTFSDESVNEDNYAEAVINCTGFDWTKITPDLDDLYTLIDPMLLVMEEPFGSLSCVAQHAIFSTIRKAGCNLVLDGQGADEQLAGYDGFWTVLFSSMLERGRIMSLKKEIKKYNQVFGASKKQYGFYDVVKHIIKSRVFRRIYLSKQQKILSSTYYIKNSRNKLIIDYLDSFLTTDASKYFHSMVCLELPGLLHYEDRNANATGLEVRFPFLQLCVVEEMAGVQLNHKIKSGVSKSLLRDALVDLLPSQIYNRVGKLGFSTPQRRIMNEKREETKRELIIACDKLGEIVDVKRIMDLFESTQIHSETNNQLFWRLICVSHWLSVFNVKLLVKKDIEL